MKIDFKKLTGWRLAAGVVLAALALWHGHAGGVVCASFLGLFGGDSSSSSTTNNTTETQQNPALSSTGGSALTSSVSSGVTGTNAGTGATALATAARYLSAGAVDLSGATGTNYSVTYNVPTADSSLLSGLASLGTSTGTSANGVQYAPASGWSLSSLLPWVIGAVVLGGLYFFLRNK